MFAAAAGVGTWALAAAVTALAGWLEAGAWAWLPWAVALGCLAHLVGDWLTPEGVPLCWPWRHRFELPLLDIHTDRWVERCIVAPLLLAVVLLAAVLRFGWLPILLRRFS